MMRSGDWITPRLNGFLYFEKPPLQYWMGAASYHLLGVNAFAARLWPALAGFLTIAAGAVTEPRLWGSGAGRPAGMAAAAAARSSSGAWARAESTAACAAAGRPNARWR